ncbi:MAG: acetyl-CoA carboxylase biotin carboxyl carrier protein subunit [Saprospiraceae bacterium]|nr:acetyl-CoA carboxylase biotin carboxyl carrier protein subunit [Saprospiraceae bacterium]
MMEEYTIDNGLEQYHAQATEVKMLDLVSVGKAWHLLTETHSLLFTDVAVDLLSKKVSFVCNGQTHCFYITDPISNQIAKLGLGQSDSKIIENIHAPMPGLVLKILVQPGESVEINQPLIVLQAMKMENLIQSPISGVIESVHVVEGQTVEKREILVHYQTA